MIAQTADVLETGLPWGQYTHIVNHKVNDTSDAMKIIGLLHAYGGVP